MSVSVNGAVVKGVVPTAEAAPAAGTRLEVTVPGRSPAGAFIFLDVTCAALDRATNRPVAHQTHWSVTL